MDLFYVSSFNSVSVFFKQVVWWIGTEVALSCVESEVRVSRKKTTNINVLLSQQWAALSGIIESCFSASGGHCGARRDGLFLMWHWHVPQTRDASQSDTRTWKSAWKRHDMIGVIEVNCTENIWKLKTFSPVQKAHWNWTSKQTHISTTFLVCKRMKSILQRGCS